MKDGFIKVCAATPDIRVADCVYNTEKIKALINDAEKSGAKLIVLPELSVTSATAGDLFFQKKLTSCAKESVLSLAKATGDIVAVVGFPFRYDNALYNTAAILYNGEVLALTAKSTLSAEEQRYFTKKEDVTYIQFGEYSVPFGKNIIVRDENLDGFSMSVTFPDSSFDNGTTIFSMPSALVQLAGKKDYLKDIVKVDSALSHSAFVVAMAGEGESTGDVLYGGENIIAEDGDIIALGKRFENSVIYQDIDLEKLSFERMSATKFSENFSCTTVYTSFSVSKTTLTRHIHKTPFVPEDTLLINERAREIIEIQSLGLKKRLLHTGAKNAVIGISGGLDSTLALLITANAFDKAKLDRKGIIAVTMPCFGTTDRTYNNAVNLTNSLGATLVEIDIKDSVLSHFADIGQDSTCYDVTYENAQARERTQVLMDIANMHSGLVIGTGDLSELALGWATYNGDHMSMYGVNSDVPKTLVRHLVSYFKEISDNALLKTTLYDILDTPVSPELLPPDKDEISQKTENIVGPYALHDFFLYYALRYGFSPKKIYRMACIAFDGEYDDNTILHWEKLFYKRFFASQFKRSCVPDGIKVGSVSLSPRGDFKMPSDAVFTLWEDELKSI